jgi:hypothetical protein
MYIPYHSSRRTPASSALTLNFWHNPNARLARILKEFLKWENGVSVQARCRKRGSSSNLQLFAAKETDLQVAFYAAIAQRLVSNN